MENITVGLTSCYTCLDSAALHTINYQENYLSGQIQNSQTGGQLYIDTSPYSMMPPSGRTGPRAPAALSLSHVCQMSDL